jgi:hypothetical protein
LPSSNRARSPRSSSRAAAPRRGERSVAVSRVAVDLARRRGRPASRARRPTTAFTIVRFAYIHISVTPLTHALAAAKINAHTPSVVPTKSDPLSALNNPSVPAFAAAAAQHASPPVVGSPHRTNPHACANTPRSAVVTASSPSRASSRLASSSSSSRVSRLASRRTARCARSSSRALRNALFRVARAVGIARRRPAPRPGAARTVVGRRIVARIVARSRVRRIVVVRVVAVGVRVGIASIVVVVVVVNSRRAPRRRLTASNRFDASESIKVSTLRPPGDVFFTKVGILYCRWH